ncbi:MAG: hypothetical protein IJA79_08700 [Desulfovibrio sp.]|nr:hypothetical protein [Desulfovibrio sp.]
MSSLTFDTLGYFEKLKAAGVPDAQAKVQVEAMQDVVRQYDESSRKELATKGDIQDVRLEMKSMEMRLLKWQIGLAVAIIAIMAKGFGWLGF